MLSHIVPDTIAEMARVSPIRPYRAGQTIGWVNEDDWVGVVVKGIVGVVVSTPNGRQVTVGYAREGTLLGIGSLFRPVGSNNSFFEATTDCRIAEISHRALMRRARRDPDLASGLAALISERLDSSLTVAAVVAFGSIRTRLARQLLQTAVTDSSTGTTISPLSQRQLAAALGSNVDVVGRNLRAMANEGLVALGFRRVVLTSLEALDVEARNFG